MKEAKVKAVGASRVESSDRVAVQERKERLHPNKSGKPAPAAASADAYVPVHSRYLARIATGPRRSHGGSPSLSGAAPFVTIYRELTRGRLSPPFPGVDLTSRRKFRGGKSAQRRTASEGRFRPFSLSRASQFCGSQLALRVGSRYIVVVKRKLLRTVIEGKLFHCVA